jgi:hypothetical protein
VLLEHKEISFSWTSGAIILATFVALFAVLKWPRRYRAGDDAMGEGCVIMFLWMLAGLGLVLGLAAWFAVRWLVYGIFIITAVPAAFATPFLVSELWKDRRKKVGTRIPPAELQSRLLGRTHVSPPAIDETGKYFREFRRYESAGRLTIQREDAGVLGSPREAQWSVEKGRLAILDPAMHATRKQRFTLRQTPDGQIRYCIYEPLSRRLHGQLSFHTAEIRDGDAKNSGSGTQ